jgi:hypothetical protein
VSLLVVLIARSHPDVRAYWNSGVIESIENLNSFNFATQFELRITAFRCKYDRSEDTFVQSDEPTRECVE